MSNHQCPNCGSHHVPDVSRNDGSWCGYCGTRWWSGSGTKFVPTRLQPQKPTIDDDVQWLRNSHERGFRIATEIERLSRRLAIAERVVLELYEWYDRDGSVGGADNVFEDNRDVLEQMQKVGEA